MTSIGREGHSLWVTGITGVSAFAVIKYMDNKVASLTQQHGDCFALGVKWHNSL